MQFPPASAPDLDAALAPGQVRYIKARLLFDWNRNGLFNHAYSDLSDCLTDYVLDRQLTGNLPTDVTLVQGYSAATLDLTLAGAPVFTGAVGVIPLFAKFNTASPFWTTVGGVTSPLAVEGIPITLDLIVTVPATGATYTIRRFTGKTRVCELQRGGGQVKISCLDPAGSLATLLQLPLLAMDGGTLAFHNQVTTTGNPSEQGSQPYMNSAGVIDFALRSSGLFIGPKPHSTCISSIPMTGLYWADSAGGGNGSAFGTPEFPGVPVNSSSLIANEVLGWIPGKYGPAPASSFTTFPYMDQFSNAFIDPISFASPGAPQSVGMGFWIYGPQPIFPAFFAAVGVQLGVSIFLNLLMTPSGQVQSRLIDTAHSFDSTLTATGAPLTPGWHYIATVTTFSGTGADCVFFVDGAVQTIQSYFFPNVNPRFETGVSPWQVSGGTLVQSSTQRHSGVFSAQITPNGIAAFVNIVSELISVVEGHSYTANIWVWFTAAVTANFSASISWFDASGSFISTVNTFVSVPATTWTNVVNTLTAPTGAAFATLTPLLQGTPASSQVWYVDDAFMITNGFGPNSPLATPLIVSFTACMPMQYIQVWQYPGTATRMVAGDLGVWPMNPPATVTPHHLSVGMNLLTNLPQQVNVDAWSLIKEVAAAELGVVFFDEYGSFKFYSRADLRSFFQYPTGSTASTAPTLNTDWVTDIDMVGALDGVRNIVAWESTSATAWFQTVYQPAQYNTLDVAPHSTLVVQIQSSTITEFETDGGFIPTTDPTNWGSLGVIKGWFAYRTDTLADINATSGPNPGNSLGGVTVQIIPSVGGQFCTLSITNVNSYTVRFASLSSAGTGSPTFRMGGYSVISDPKQSGSVAHAGSRAVFGDQTLSLGSSPWVQFPASAQAIAASVLVDTKSPVPILQQIPMVGDPRIQLGDVLPIVDPGYSGSRFIAVVTAIHETFIAPQSVSGVGIPASSSPAGTMHGQGLSTDLLLSLMSPPGAWILGDPIWGILGTTTQLV